MQDITTFERQLFNQLNVLYDDIGYNFTSKSFTHLQKQYIVQWIISNCFYVAATRCNLLVKNNNPPLHVKKFFTFETNDIIPCSTHLKKYFLETRKYYNINYGLISSKRLPQYHFSYYMSILEKYLNERLYNFLKQFMNKYSTKFTFDIIFKVGLTCNKNNNKNIEELIPFYFQKINTIDDYISYTKSYILQCEIVKQCQMPSTCLKCWNTVFSSVTHYKIKNIKINPTLIVNSGKTVTGPTIPIIERNPTIIYAFDILFCNVSSEMCFDVYTHILKDLWNTPNLPSKKKFIYSLNAFINDLIGTYKKYIKNIACVDSYNIYKNEVKRKLTSHNINNYFL